MIALTYCLKIVSRLCLKDRTPSPEVLLKCGDGARNPGRLRELGYTGQNTGEEGTVQRDTRPRDVNKSPSHVFQLVLYNVYEETARLQRKNHLKRAEGISTESHRSKNSSFFHQPN